MIKVDYLTAPATPTAILSCEECERATRHDFVRRWAVKCFDPYYTLIFACRRCSKERIWGTEDLLCD